MKIQIVLLYNMARKTSNQKLTELLYGMVKRLKHMENVLKRHNIKFTQDGGSIWDDIENAVGSVARTVSSVVGPAVEVYKTVAPLLQESGGQTNGGDIFSDIGSFLGLGIGEKMMNNKKLTTSKQLQQHTLFDSDKYQKHMANKLIREKKRSGGYTFDGGEDNGWGGEYEFDGGEYDFEGGSEKTKGKSKLLNRRKK